MAPTFTEHNIIKNNNNSQGLGIGLFLQLNKKKKSTISSLKNFYLREKKRKKKLTDGSLLTVKGEVLSIQPVITEAPGCPHSSWGRSQPSR